VVLLVLSSSWNKTAAGTAEVEDVGEGDGDSAVTAAGFEDDDDDPLAPFVAEGVIP
jgi:hypothetical protein